MISKAVIMYIAEPMLKSIIKDVFSSDEVSSELRAIRNSMYDAVCKATKKTRFMSDDIIVEACFKAMSDPSSYIEGGDTILDLFEEWIKSSKTQWDDILIQPIIDLIRETANIPDND